MRASLSRLAGAALALLLILGAPLWASALDVPPYTTRVNDLAKMMSPVTRQDIEARLADLEATDSTQVAVLTVPSLEGDSIEDFSIRVAEAWKVGRKDFDNGVILLVSKQDRKIRIEVGYGLEGRLTDVLSGRIIDNVITPQFKAGDFDRGFSDGVAAICGAVRGEYTAPQPKPKSKINILAILIGPMIFMILFTEKFGRRRSDVTGKSNSVRRSGSGFIFLPGPRIGGGGGFGGGGGGFGGFGGGGFGGGGASGGW
ncbi:TPM domain-containing protein [Pseudodesulfovibrio indicus]|uniref:TPM domain-containing protein n=1 Tax=Pseudodesulfovibrio indicus TaxID=1716143 RepID=UPI0029305DF1|nr:TPM domain-containing protein [Pseudodesulfovibrio indicus]